MALTLFIPKNLAQCSGSKYLGSNVQGPHIIGLLIKNLKSKYLEPKHGMIRLLLYLFLQNVAQCSGPKYLGSKCLGSPYYWCTYSFGP